MDKLVRMPWSVVQEAYNCLCEGGHNLKQKQWNQIVAMIHFGQISVNNAQKLIRIMMTTHG